MNSKGSSTDGISKSDLAIIAARWEAICTLLDGGRVSDFMLSFPEVRKVADLIQITKEG